MLIKQNEHYQTSLVHQTISNKLLDISEFDLGSDCALQIANAIDNSQTIGQMGTEWFIDANKWGSFLFELMIKSGVTGRKDSEIMDTQQVQQFQRYLWKRCKKYTINELFLAVEKNTFGEYPIRIKSYNNISIEFIGECLEQYELLRNNYLKFTNKAVEKLSIADVESKKKEVWDANKNQIMDDLLAEEIGKYKSGKLSLSFGASVYDLFANNGYIKNTNEEKNKAMIEAKESLESQAIYSTDRDNVKKLREQLADEVKSKNVIISEAKKMLYLKFLKEQVANLKKF
jgi:hypothetical protein